jgi:ATP-dependent helicase YprA (DUF1998 family)
MALFEPQHTYYSSQSVYNTVAGRALVVDILARSQPRPIEPHDYQLEGICHALDGVDLVATMATGAGKTGFYCFLMLVIRKISQDPDMALDGMTFPRNPCMLLISPTKALQQDMVCSFFILSLISNS